MAAFDDVLDLQQRMREMLAVERIDELSAGWGLLEWHDPIPEPLVAWFSTVDDHAFTAGHYELESSHPLLEVGVGEDAAGGPIFAPRVLGDAIRLGEITQDVELAMGLAEMAGTEVLVSPDYSLTHPLYGLFTRRMRERGICLERRG